MDELLKKGVGFAQRYVPAHVAHEYCRSDRSFRDTETAFTEEKLPRELKVSYADPDTFYPLIDSKGLGFEYAFIRACGSYAVEWSMGGRGSGLYRDGERVDLAAVRALSAARTRELELLKEYLMKAVGSDLEVKGPQVGR